MFLARFFVNFKLFTRFFFAFSNIYVCVCVARATYCFTFFTWFVRWKITLFLFELQPNLNILLKLSFLFVLAFCFRYGNETRQRCKWLFDPIWTNFGRNLNKKFFLTKNFDQEDEFEDETLSERLWGLTEMFPAPVRKVTGVVSERTVDASKSIYKWSRAGLWIFASSFTVLLLPVIIENERSNLEEMQASQQREMLLGPSAAASGGGSSANLASAMPFGFGPGSTPGK